MSIEGSACSGLSTSGNKVDFLIENDKGFRIVEFKASMTVMPDMFKGMEKFQQLSGWKDLNKALVYGGNDRQNRTAGKVVLGKNLKWNKIRSRTIE